jgi:hypothetical protein
MKVRTAGPGEGSHYPDSMGFLAFSQPAIPSGIAYTFV